MPEWIEPTFRFTPGVDPIGLRALTAGRIVAPLTPAIMALSERARYLSFYLWLFKRYADQRRSLSIGALGSYILAREYDFGLAVRLCPNGCNASPVGMQRVGPAVARQPAEYARGESVQSPLGGYGLYYRTPMRVLELVRPQGTALGDTASPLDMLNRGSPVATALADAFEAAVGDTEYVHSYADGDGPIPSAALVEYASRACLCRLTDYPDERDLIRVAYLKRTEGQSHEDVSRRREAFALFLDLAARGLKPDRGDDDLRWGVWQASSAAGQDSPARRGTLARWSALAAIHFLQDGLNLLWLDGGNSIRQSDHGDGLDWADVQAALASLADTGNIELPGGAVHVTADTDARAFATDVAQAVRVGGLIETVQWARGDKRAIAGAALILAVLSQLPDDSAVDPGWREVAWVNGDWQPGLATLAGRVREHLGEGGTVGRLLVWLIDHLVIRAHENNAYSKLPDFTFRWRWEAGRLRFYDHPIAWDALGDIRASVLTSLLTDLGYLARSDGAATPTPDGRALVQEVFGA